MKHKSKISWNPAVPVPDYEDFKKVFDYLGLSESEYQHEYKAIGGKWEASQTTTTTLKESVKKNKTEPSTPLSKEDEKL